MSAAAAGNFPSTSRGRASSAQNNSQRRQAHTSNMFRRRKRQPWIAPQMSHVRGPIPLSASLSGERPLVRGPTDAGGRNTDFNVAPANRTPDKSPSKTSSVSLERQRELDRQCLRNLDRKKAAENIGGGNNNSYRYHDNATGSSRNPDQAFRSRRQQDLLIGRTTSLKGIDCDISSVRRFAHPMITEYIKDGNAEELLKVFSERAHPNTVELFLDCFIGGSIDVSTDRRVCAGEAIRELRRARVVSEHQIYGAFRKQLSTAEETAIDMPRYYEFMAEIMAPLFVSKDIAFSYFLRSVKNCLVTSNTAKMLVPLFKRIREINNEGISRLWKNSGMHLIELVDGLPERDAKAIGAALGLSEQKMSTSLMAKRPPPKYHELCERFRFALSSSTSSERLDEVLTSRVNESIWMAGEHQRKVTLRAFVTTLLNIGLRQDENIATQRDECIINVKRIDAKLHIDPASNRKTVPNSIKDLFDEGDIAMQALYALQNVMIRQHLAKESLADFLFWLHDRDLVSKEAIKEWASLERTRYEQMPDWVKEASGGDGLNSILNDSPIDDTGAVIPANVPLPDDDSDLSVHTRESSASRQCEQETALESVTEINLED